jgi:predicted metal-dependent hydrolase
MPDNVLSGPAHIPGGPYPRPRESPHQAKASPRLAEGWRESEAFRRGFDLFNAGYYWEAHEIWELLWNHEGRVGAVADLLRGLIKLAAAGVKVRQNQRHGVVTHGARAAERFDAARAAEGSPLLGMDLVRLAEIAASIANDPPTTPTNLHDPLVRVFEFTLLPSE